MGDEWIGDAMDWDGEKKNILCDTENSADFWYQIGSEVIFTEQEAEHICSTFKDKGACSEAPSCAESFDVGLQYLSTEDAQDYVAMHLWALVEDYLGSDEEIELDDEKKATLKSYILEFVTALPTVTNVLKASRTNYACFQAMVI